MTKPQIWVSVFLALFILLFILGRITKKEKEESNFTPQNEMQNSEGTGTDLTAGELMNRFGCYNCHGNDLKGTNLAPALQNLSEFWSRDKLINYLRNPSSYMDSDRFIEYRKKYPGAMMPPFSNIDIKDLGKISDYLLGL